MMCTQCSAFSENPLVPLHQLLFSVQTAVTTLTCVVEMFSWQYTKFEEIKLCTIYSLYILLALVMGYDSYSRVGSALEGKPKSA
jgi:hypothetical protein